jgi:hypothetical protein
MTLASVAAAAPLDDLATRGRGRGLQIVLLVVGATLLSRFIRWLSVRITDRIDASGTEPDALVRSEVAKHRHAWRR